MLSPLFSFPAAVLRLAVRAPVARVTAARDVPRAFFGAEAAAKPVSTAEVVTPETVDTLEWVLDSPPTLHQFEEPPIVVEIAHLM